MVKRILIKCARLCVCVILGTVLGLALPLAVEQFMPSYKYYAEVNE